MSLNYILLGKRIRGIRKRKGITQLSLADRINRSTSYISYIENGVKEIGTSAFYYCDALTTVRIPDSVTTIGDGAFQQ